MQSEPWVAQSTATSKIEMTKVEHLNDPKNARISL
jgi:hypothetical protein